MVKRIKKLWTKALRSGKYKQCHDKLKDGKNGFCCLGVLTDIWVKAKKKSWTNSATNGAGNKERLYSMSHLPVEVIEWAGLKDENPDVYVCEKFFSLSRLNDDENFSFNKIADAIDSNKTL